MHRLIGLFLVLVPSGCTGGETPTTDAQEAEDAQDADAVRKPCWPLDGTSPGGELQLGRAEPFEPIEEEQEVAVVVGLQGGVHIDLRSRISGLLPGNPPRVLDPDNPYTRFLVFAEDGERLSASSCPVRYPYEPDPDGSGFDVLIFNANAVFDADKVTPSNAEELVGQRLRLTGEVIDAASSYAVDEKWVVVAEVIQPE
jgi:hypothetical protein